jgi:hypothetical protein
MRLGESGGGRSRRADQARHQDGRNAPVERNPPVAEEPPPSWAIELVPRPKDGPAQPPYGRPGGRPGPSQAGSGGRSIDVGLERLAVAAANVNVAT